jgi:PhzF family phenazine biosynthesis protein
MKLKLFQIDAFTSNVFGGNPAAVCPLDAWLPSEVMLKIAAENNLAETAYFVKINDTRYQIRWFTPDIEMDLCGHATLASAFVIFNELAYKNSVITFESRSGDLIVNKIKDAFELDFPSRMPTVSDLPAIIYDSLNIKPKEIFKSRDYVLVYENEQEIRDLKPDQAILNQINLDPGGIIVTAKGDKADFVSRFFTPQSTLFEDPVTGSAHCSLVPFWAERLMKNKLFAQQVSPRLGEIQCTFLGDRILLKGHAVKYLEGDIFI